MPQTQVVTIELPNGPEVGEKLQVLLDKLNEARDVLSEVKELAAGLPPLTIDAQSVGLVKLGDRLMQEPLY